MGKIISRVKTEGVIEKRLAALVEVASEDLTLLVDEIPPGPSRAEELMTQVEDIVITLIITADGLDQENNRLEGLIVRMQADLQTQREIVELLATSGVPYDEDLDHATIDFMESILGSGIAEATFDGELAFADGVIASKEDIKPMIREAISSYLQLKLR